MGTYDDFRNRMQAHGNTQSASYDNATVSFIQKTFQDSPFYYDITIDGNSIGCRVQRNIKSFFVRQLTFLPGTKVNLGGIVNYNNETWIISSITDHPLYPSVLMTQSNGTLNWNDANGVLHQVPFYGTPLTREMSEIANDFVDTGKYQIYNNAPFQSDAKNIQIGQRFIIRNHAVVVTGIDTSSTVYGDYGILQIGMVNDIVLDSDDLINSVADNSKLWTKQNSNPVSPTPPNGSGNLW